MCFSAGAGTAQPCCLALLPGAYLSSPTCPARTTSSSPACWLSWRSLPLCICCEVI